MATKRVPSKPLNRLLNIFPVAAMRAQWKIGGRTKLDVIDGVIAKIHTANITDFVEKSMGLTKQHIYLYEHDLKRLADLPSNVLTNFGPDKVHRTNTTIEFFYLIPLEFRYVAGSPPEEGSIDFPWPVRFVFRKGIVEAHLTTMEKDLEAYLEDLTPVYSVHRDIEDRDILEDFRKTLDRTTTLVSLDINRGVKHLWANNFIDAPRAAWKSAVSTKIDAMDGQYMVKRDDPNEYAQAIACPLLKTIFKVLAPGVNWPEVLLIDATGGEISIPRYSNDPTAIENVIGEILRHN
jgi:hypothetical protein